jgi:hypothetical protein
MTKEELERQKSTEQRQEIIDTLDVCHDLGMDRVYTEQERYNEREMRISVPEACMQEEEDEDAGKGVDQDIEEVVYERVRSPELVLNGQEDQWQRTVRRIDLVDIRIACPEIRGQKGGMPETPCWTI